MGTVHTRLTMEDFLGLPELPAGKRELLRGELFELPPAKFRHHDIADRICDWLKAAAAKSGFGGRVFMEMGYMVSPSHWLQPDVSVTHPGQPVQDYLEGSPLLAVEVIPEGNSASVIDAKIAAYLSFGAAEVWIVYPSQGHMWVYHPGPTADCHRGAYASPLFAGEIIDLDHILD